MNSKKNVTIYDLADELNLSTSTISRALKDHPSIAEKTRRKVKKLATSYGFVPNSMAASLRNKKTKIIGVIAPQINRPFHSSLISGIEHIAKASGYNVLISQSHEQFEIEKGNIQAMIASHVEGLVISISVETKDIDHITKLIEKGIPVIFVDRVPEGLEADMVVIDNYKAAFEATEHLILQGSKRIAYMGLSDIWLYQERLRGYKDALKKYDLTIAEELIETNCLDAEITAELTRKCLDTKSPPDGIFATSDTIGVSVIQAAKAKGVKIPDQLNVIGFNNDPISRIIEPNLSTISQPEYDMGVVAAQHLFNKISEKNGIAQSSKIQLKTELLARGSSLRNS
jgi:DNA-binding LacI/PurR family transcriptional regulator